MASGDPNPSNPAPSGVPEASAAPATAEAGYSAGPAERREGRLPKLTHRQLQELAALHQVANAGAEATDEFSLIDRATAIIGAGLFPDNVGVLLLDEPAGVLRVHPSYQGVDAADRQMLIPLGQGITGTVAATGKPWRAGDVGSEPRYLQVVPGTRSELCVPLKLGERVIGVVNAESRRGQAFDEADERLLTTLAGQLAIAIDRLRAEQAERRSTLRAAESRAVLYRASQEISGSLDPEQVFAATHRAAAELMPCEAFVIAIVDEAGQEIELAYAVDKGERVPTRRLRLGQGLTGHVIATGEAMFIDHVDELDRVQPFHFGHPDHIAAAVIVPMRLRGQVFGALSAQSYQRGRYTAEDQQMLELLANQAAVAIEHARLFEAEREQRQLAEVLHQTATILAASLDLEAVLDRLLEQVARLVPYDTGVILLVDGDRLHIARQAGYDRLGEDVAARVGGLTFELATTMTLRTVIETGQPLIIPDTAQFPGWVRVPASAHIRSWIGAPMVAQGQTIAVFALDKIEPGFYQPRHARSLATFAGQAALAVKNAQLFEAERRRVAALTALHATGLDVSQQLELPRLLRTIVERAAMLLEAGNGVLYLVLPEDRTLECVVSLTGRDTFVGMRLRFGEGVAGHVAASGQPWLEGDYPTWSGRSEQFAGARMRSVMGVPIQWQDHVLGVLVVSDDRVNRFGAHDIELVGLFAAQAAGAIVNARLFEEALGKATELGVLFGAAQAMAACREPSEVFEVLARYLTEALDATSSYVSEVRQEAGMFTVLAEYWSEVAAGPERVSDLGRSYLLADFPATVRALAEGATQELHAGDASNSADEQQMLESYGVSTALLVPMIARGRALGEAEVWESRRRRSFTAAERRLAQTLVQQATDVIENVRLIAALESEKLQLELLYNLSQRLTASLDLREVAGRALDLVRGALQASLAQLFVPAANTDRVRLIASSAVQPAAAGAADEAVEIALGRGLVGRAAFMRQAIIAGDVRHDPQWEPLPGAPEGATSAAAVPLLLGDELVGVFAVVTTGAATLSAEQRPILAAIAAPMALALQNARLYAAETTRAHHLALLNEITQAAVSALDFPVLMQTLADRLVELLDAEGCCLTLWDEDRQRPVPAAAAGAWRALYGEAEPKAGDRSLTEAALRAGHALIVGGAEAPASSGSRPGEGPGARSLLALPLLAGGRRLGAALIACRALQAVTPQEVERGEQAAGQVALAIAKAHLLEETRRHADEVTTVSDVMRALNATASVLDAFPGIVAGLRAISLCERVSLLLFDEPRETFTVVAADPAERRPGPGARLPLASLAAAKAVLAGLPHLAPDLADERDYPVEADLYAAGQRSSASLPLRVGHRVVGLLALAWPAPRGYADSNLSALGQIVDAVALALEKNRLFDETRRRADELAVLVELSAALRSARSIDELLPIFLQKACEVCSSQTSAIYLIEAETGDLVLRGCHPFNRSLVGLRQPAGEGITGYVAATGQTHIANELSFDPLANSRHPAEIEYLRRVRSSMAVPLRTHEGVVGVMHLGAHEPHVFTPTEIHLLTTIAEIAGNALQRATLLATLEQRVAERTAELANANERLKELDRLKDQFISNVSHELRTPLTNIKLHLSLLEKRGLETLGRYLPTLQRETERLRRLIEDLLDLSRLQAQITPPRREVQPIEGLIAEVVALQATRAEAHGLKLEQRLDPNLAPAPIDRAQMLQVLTNLVGNAVAYTPRGAGVQVSSAAGALDGRPCVVVKVHNDGVCIAPDDMPHLFERFYRGKTGIESGEAGTGLGLSICKEIVEQHGGRITVSSTEASGTEFSVWLPLDV